MDPTITAALIAGIVSLISLGGTVAIGIAGFRNSTRATKATVEAGTASTVLALDAARADRLWDAQAAAYADAIRILRHRIALRPEQIRSLRFDDKTEKAIEESIASMAHPEWVTAEARVMAFASPSVLEAMRASLVADDKVRSLLATLRDLQSQAASALPMVHAGPNGATVLAALDAVKDAVEKANDKDNELFEAIRADLHHRPSQILASAADRNTAVVEKTLVGLMWPGTR